MKQTLQVSAPGSMMVTGEHAVVYGQPAIVCAIEQRVQVSVSTLETRIAEVHSTIAAPVTMSLDNIVIDGPMKFVLAAISHYADKLQCGMRINITSEINHTMGLGSSAAVTAASLAAIDILVRDNPALDKLKHDLPTSSEQAKSKLPDIAGLHKTGLQITRSIQCRGSGADLAASLHGGMIAYQLPSTGDRSAGNRSPGNGSAGNGVVDNCRNASMQLLPMPPLLSLRYVGYKTPTAEVLARIAAAREGNEQYYDDLYQLMGDCAAATISAAQSNNWNSFGNYLQQYQNHMQALGVSDDALEQLISDARRNPETMAVKISGSGLGDCVVALGSVPDGFTRLTVASEGLRIDA